MTEVMSTMHIADLLRGKGIAPPISEPPVPEQLLDEAILDLLAEKPKKTVSTRKNYLKKQCPHCKKYFPSNGVGLHIVSCSFNMNRTNISFATCPKCNFGVSVRSLKKHEDACDDNPATTVEASLRSERTKFFRDHKIRAKSGANNFNYPFPAPYVRNMNKMFAERGMNPDWAIDNNLRLVQNGVTVDEEFRVVTASNPVVVSGAVENIVKSHPKAAKKIETKSHEGVATILTELLVEEMGASDLAKKINVFMQWHELTTQLLEK